jgi:hydrogenase expression/formation protein HypE
MKAGKLNWDDLNEIINNNRGNRRKEVRINGAVGEDCSIIEYGDFDCVLSTDPITGASRNIGRLAVNINCNDIASSGTEPLGILVTILAPESSTLNDIKSVMEEISSECRKLNIEIIGGHTEITGSVNRMIVSCTVIGKGICGSAVATSGAQLNDDIVVTKNLCLEGTSIIVNDYYDNVKTFLDKDEIEEARDYINNISVLKEGLIAGKYGVNSMHDITEGGVLGALWEVSTASKKGFMVNGDKLPLTPVTRKICSAFDIDPLKLISSGSMLITCKKGEGLLKALDEEGIKATIIGKITKDKGLVSNADKSYEVPPPERDELFVLGDKIKDSRREI